MAATEKDGLGAAWSCKETGRFGRVRASGMEAINGGLAPFCEGFAKLEPQVYDGGAVICHGRTSTNFIGLDNTHPFVMRDKGRLFCLAHNGVVTSDKYATRAGGCDSELILEAFVKGGMAEVAKHIDGYYALVILEKSKGRTLLHIVRDGMASLFCGRIGEAWAFATTEHILRQGGATPVSGFKKNTHVIFEGNKLVSCKGFTPAVRVYKTPGHSYQLSAKARKAFAGQQYGLELEAEE
jgi:glutamine phosphoribosylpyrophosphate amidotransferase